MEQLTETKKVSIIKKGVAFKNNKEIDALEQIAEQLEGYTDVIYVSRRPTSYYGAGAHSTKVSYNSGTKTRITKVNLGVWSTMQGNVSRHMVEEVVDFVKGDGAQKWYNKMEKKYK